MKQKHREIIFNSIEMAIVYVILISIVVFSSSVVKLGNTTGIKMLLAVMILALAHGLHDAVITILSYVLL